MEQPVKVTIMSQIMIYDDSRMLPDADKANMRADIQERTSRVKRKGSWRWAKGALHGQNVFQLGE